MRFADQVVSTVDASTRPKLVAGARQLVAKVAADEEKKLVVALGKLGIDWTPAAAPAGAPGAANVDVSLAVTPGGTVHAGDEITLTATAKNTGTATAYRVLPRIDADDSLFEDVELPIGKLGPGETKTFSTKIKVPLDAYDRVDQLALEVREAPTAPVHTATTELHLEAAPHPVFAYSWQLVETSGNGDGLVQPGESYKLLVSVKNAGLGPTHSATVLLRNATGDGVTLGTSRVELKAPLAPGEVKQLEMPLSTDASLKADEVTLELVAYDSDLNAETSDKLHFPVRAAVPGHAAQGTVTVKQPVAIRAGAADDASIVGEAPHGASYVEVGTFGAWTKVNLDQGGSRIGFVPTRDLASGGSGMGSYAATWNANPPRISLAMKTLETTADTFKLEGTASDDQHVEDVYAFVSNQNAKIDQRKVFYHSNRGGKNGKLVDFTAELPLWPGSNMITVVARSSAEVRTMKTVFVYRDPARTASTP
jgi:carboxyl-terminal processing protease